jgi:hypothetical protein
VAADTQTTAYNYAHRAQKIVRLPDGGVAAACGEAAAGYAGLKWLMEGERGDGPEIEDAYIVIVRPDKSIWVAEGRWPAYPILDTTYAHGCGRDLARMAMSQGKSPVDAVAEACEHDAMSSGPIMAMTVYPPRGDGLEIYEVRATARKRKARR